MYLGYSLPTDWTYAGTAVFTGTTAANLHGRDTSKKAIITWPTATQTTAINITIAGNRGAGFSPRVAGMIGLSLPVGTKITITGKLVAGGTQALGGNSTGQRTALMPDGTVGIHWVFDAALPPCNGYTITVFNDVNGSATLTSGQTVTIEQIQFAPAVYMDHQVGWNSGRSNPASSITRTLGGQINSVRRPSWRRRSLVPLRLTGNQMRGNGLDNALDYETLLSIVCNDPFVWLIENGTTPALIQRSGMFGVVTNVPDVDNNAGGYYQPNAIDFEEIPA